MTIEFDKITFETREEVRDTMTILASWLKDHEGERPTHTADRLYDLLDVMDMSW